MSTAQQPCVVPSDVRYVVTLDADTKLPRDTVRRLIGKMAHPLNRPRFDADAGRVVEGYAVLQPRVTPSLPIGREGSLFQRVFSGMSGIDPYAAAVSDVYQDMFGEGSYAGKGIYEVDPFEAAVAGRVLDSTLLSHDLFEGVFARAGLASDVEVVDEFPARYDVAALRHHRWARGDLAIATLDLGSRPRRQRGSEAWRNPIDRPLENGRQSATYAVGSGCSPRLAGRMDLVVRGSRDLDFIRTRDDRTADPDPRRRCRDPGADRNHGSEPSRGAQR